MKILSKELFNEINTFMSTEARQLEKTLFNFYFNKASIDDILDSLELYQNPDGGFGQGLEPDFKLKDSSPMATSIGLRYLSKIDNSHRAQDMISKAIRYLEITFDSNRNGWFSVPSNVNDYPHASWWKFKEDINMTVIDYSWGNPTAELIGYLYKYRKYLEKIEIESLMNFSINYFNNLKEFKSEHEIFCFIRMSNTIDDIYSSKIESTLRLAINKLVNVDENDWTNYVPTPLKFIEIDSKNYFGIDKKHIEQNLDYLITNFEDNGKILPTWEWDNYLDVWDNAKIEWIGILTLEAMLSLLKFNRIRLM
ncbi:hypothetical protein [Tissierella sp. Yu-01]|uniref:hypothetical protein n=1 Tax=Tissierella sp. Yu-01 TaxID=3035694 RepID=UPI00240D126F|nr:hypothetical protein [Tissierella sp. Yu-01]WFA08797.1 hypothetical protein P3962_13880 [Tissierella sp. Yu-01]